MFERMAGARFVVLRDAAHNPMADRPAEFNRVLLEFLDA
jgi:pimeloyl-ACP methyl ester carboxylesterase